jgi:uncharacterized protein YutE (UPF0331/DUF86 family)
MRNHVIHAYWQIGFRIIAETIAVDMEPLKLVTQLIELVEGTGA